MRAGAAGARIALMRPTVHLGAMARHTRGVAQHMRGLARHMLGLARHGALLGQRMLKSLEIQQNGLISSRSLSPVR